MSLPLLHAGRTNPGLSAALDLRFALDKSLTAYRGPTPSFSRASTASYFDGSGVLRYKGYNLCLNSENFSAASWSKTNISASFSSTELSPNGDLTASLVVPNTANNVHHINPSTFNGAASSYTLSIYAKNSGYPVLLLDANADVNFGATFNLATGTVTGTSGGSTATITSVGNGWYRCSITKESSFTFLIWRIYPNSSGVYSGDGSSGVLLWGAQVERTAILTDYSKTTSSANSAPRFDHTYNGTSWVSRGLLVEEQRTNLVQHSEDFGNAYWTKINGSNTNNQVISPDGATTADKFTENSSSGTHLVLGSGGSVANNTICTATCFVKKGDRRYVYLTINDGSATRLRYTVIFDLDTESGVNEYSIGSPSGTGYSITNCGNGWYRISVKIQTGASQIYATEIAIGMSDSSSPASRDYTNPIYTGNGTSHFYLWGAQVEVGAFPTSYIPAITATTRSADVCQITGGDFSGFWNGTEGSISIECDRIFTGSADNYLLNIQNATGTNTIYGEYYNGNIGFQVYYGAGTPPSVSFASSGAGISSKLAYGFSSSGYSGSKDGSEVTQRTATQMGSGYDRFYIGYRGDGFYWNGHIARLRYYRKRLPNATLQLLSDPDPTLNLQFALNKTLTPVAGPTPSFSRASTGTYFNASGVLTSASINTPRFDHVYSGGQWVSRGLLVEEQRTNAFQWSEDFSNAFWTKLNASIATSSGTSPDGTNTANKITGDSTNGTHRIYRGNVGTAGQPCTTSFYLKAGTARYAIVLNSDNNDWRAYAVADLQTGTITQNGVMVAATGASYIGSSITNCGDGWYRVSVSGTNQNGDANYYGQVALSNSATPGTIPSYIGTGSYIYAVMAQMELNSSFPTSYIKTTSSTVTRSADVCQITGTSFGSMWNQGEGSVNFEFDLIPPSTVTGTGSSPSLIAFSDSSNNQRVWYDADTTPRTRLYVDNLSTSSNLYVNGNVWGGVGQKVAYCFKVDDLASCLNGGAVQTDNSQGIPTGIDRMSVGYNAAYGANGRMNGHIAKLIYYPARLTNTKLQQLST